MPLPDIHCPACHSPRVGPDEESPDGAEWSCIDCHTVFAAPDLPIPTPIHPNA